MPINIFAYDPGQTTGYCQTVVQDDGFSFEVKECREIAWDEALPIIGNLFTWVRKESIVVVESFHLFPHKAKSQIGSGFPSVRIIGVIETYAYMMGIPPKDIKYQAPSDISRVEVLPEHVKMVAGSPHKIDAYKHARLYFLKHFYNNPFDSTTDSRDTS